MDVKHYIWFIFNELINKQLSTFLNTSKCILLLFGESRRNLKNARLVLFWWSLAIKLLIAKGCGADQELC